MKILEAVYTPVAPRIDGKIDKIWEKADSTKNLWQFTTRFNEKPTETTCVKVLFDKENLYFLFVCYSHNTKILHPLVGEEDYIKLWLNPLLTHTSAYEFKVGASGRYEDKLITDDGEDEFEWDGVWFYSSKIYPDKYVIEIKIPFKILRYKKGENK